MNKYIESILKQTADDFNRCSKSVALSCAEDKEDKEDKEFLQWNLGKMNCLEEYLVEFAKMMGVELKYGWDFEVYGRGEKWEKELKYRTVEIVKEG